MKEPNPELLHKKLIEMTHRAHKAEKELAQKTLITCPSCGTLLAMVEVSHDGD